MIAAELQTSLPLVNRRTSALVAARLIARQHLEVLVYADDDGRPCGWLSADDVLNLMASPDRIPTENDLCAQLTERTVGDLLNDRRFHTDDLITVSARTPIVQLAAELVDAGARIALVAGPGDHPRFVTLERVIEGMLALCGDGRDLA